MARNWTCVIINIYNNNNLACIAPVYQRLQRRWRTDYGRENRLGLNVWQNKNVLRVDLNTASEVLETTSLLSGFQTVGAVQQKARSAKWVLVVGSCSKGVSEQWRLCEIWRDLMWRARYAGMDERRILNVSIASLYSIRWRTRSQCNCSSSGRACALPSDCVTILAAVFWTRCSFWILLTGAPYNTALQ